MRSILINELNYTSQDVEMMKPEIAPVLIEKKLKKQITEKYNLNFTKMALS